MTIHLPEDLERFIQSQVHLGRFDSADEAMSEAVRLLRQRLMSFDDQHRYNGGIGT
jgi:putative addiction module CopG family antidote